MDLNELKFLMQFMEEHGLAEVEIDEGGRRVRLRKMEARGTAAPVLIPAAPASPASAVPAAPPNENAVVFKSPLVGTFYRAARPDADPFVDVGTEVHPETVLCIIEAMKVMNEIKAEVQGVVRAVIAKNAQAVEFGEPLFEIEKKA